MTPPRQRGRATREYILERALVLYGQTPSGRPRLKALADACGMAESSLLHHFGTLDELYVEVLAARDAQTLRRYRLDTQQGIYDYLRDIAATPGLVRLFVETAVYACDPAHPAHDFYVRHRKAAIHLAQKAFGLPDDSPAARMLVAATDGLQLQWLLDPSIDLVAELKWLILTMTHNAPADQGVASQGTHNPRP